jgi:hypothetical protein
MRCGIRNSIDFIVITRDKRHVNVDLFADSLKSVFYSWFNELWMKKVHEDEEDVLLIDHSPGRVRGRIVKFLPVHESE